MEVVRICAFQIVFFSCCLTSELSYILKFNTKGNGLYSDLGIFIFQNKKIRKKEKR